MTNELTYEPLLLRKLEEESIRRTETSLEKKKVLLEREIEEAGNFLREVLLEGYPQTLTD